MAANQDYIPSQDSEFNQWFKNLSRYMARKTGGGVFTPRELKKEVL